MLDKILDVAVDLTTNLAEQDRYAKLLAAVKHAIPYSAASVLKREGQTLVPMATVGMKAEVMGRRFIVAEHPRLERIMAAGGPVRFTDPDLPDPFDGLLTDHEGPLDRVHACMGCPLKVNGETVGALTVDSANPRAFDHVDDLSVAMLGALAGAAVKTARMVEALEEAAHHQGVVTEQLLAEVEQRRGGEMLGVSQAMHAIRRDVELLSGSDLPTLITGETGVGKELVARAIHAGGRRRKQPLIYVNCAALPETIAESELFGHVRGAFTGALDQRPGKFEAADGGTLFLDEVGELPLAVQPKLLRALQNGEVQRVGSDKAIHVDVRVLAATNRNLDEEVAAGRFRADLFHRLSVYPVKVPPLRARKEDLPVLAGFFLDNARSRLALGPVRLTPGALEKLMEYDWPGNIRELEHMMLRAALKASGGRRREHVLVNVEHLDLPLPGTTTHIPGGPTGSPVLHVPLADLREATDTFQRRMVEAALAAHDGNWSRAAAQLGVDRSNLHRLARRLGMVVPRGNAEPDGAV